MQRCPNLSRCFVVIIIIFILPSARAWVSYDCRRVSAQRQPKWKLHGSNNKAAASLNDNTSKIFPTQPITEETKLWHVLCTADRLSETMKEHPLTPRVQAILHQWAQPKQWKGPQNKKLMMGLLNKSNLLHEVEESMVALGYLLDWLDERKDPSIPAITLVDVCCGKGICSMLATYIFQGDARVEKIIMMDKNKELDWSHTGIANQEAVGEHRPIMETHQCNLFEMDDIVRDILYNDEQTPLAMIGIHLCKNLSPTFVGITNALGPSKVPFLCLAPCCLPRVVLKGRNNNRILEVAQYESPLQRQARLLAAVQRRQARQRRTPCALCQSTEHRVVHCPQLVPFSEAKRQEFLADAAALEPCWKCGQLGHLKKDCPVSDQRSSHPALIPRPVTKLDVSHIIQSEDPFLVYCRSLSTAIEMKQVELFQSALQSTEGSHREHENNWNRGRKTIYIVATD